MDQLGKIRLHHWKERLEISKTVKFKSVTSEASENIAPKSCENLQTFVELAPTIQTSVKFRDFEGLYLR